MREYTQSQLEAMRNLEKLLEASHKKDEAIKRVEMLLQAKRAR